MTTSVTTLTNGEVVITTRVTGVISSPYSHGQDVSSIQERFRVGNPKALGTIQIMIGLMILLNGIVMALSRYPDSIGVYGGIFVWGSIIYIIAGSLTVAADNHLNKCLVKGSLGMNVVATVTAHIGVILYSFDTAGILNRCYGTVDCYDFEVRSRGISGVLLVLSLLELIVSIFVSAFACKAICRCCRSDPVQVLLVGNQIPLAQDGKMNPGNAAYRTEDVYQDLAGPSTDNYNTLGV
ncbi:hypothetical protein UPYG_G00095610 [Umbra pygmaea]|uniref:Membrane-spanning 4-domains subfamily A member 4A-like n=1 Tax=Umbra pygmaea TaxID=75934 RepID=A0ABD0X078_UMBPY